MTDIHYRNEPPDWHPGAATCVPGGCRGVWREVRGHNTEERGWRWQCDHQRCPLAGGSETQRRTG